MKAKLNSDVAVAGAFVVWEYVGRSDSFFGGNLDDRLLCVNTDGIFAFRRSGRERLGWKPARFETARQAVEAGRVLGRDGALWSPLFVTEIEGGE